MNAISVREIKKLIAKYNKELDIREYGTLSKSALISATTGKKPLNQALLSKLVRDAEKVRRQTNPKSMEKDDEPKALKKPSPKRVGQTKGKVSKEILDEVKGKKKEEKKRVGQTKGKVSKAILDEVKGKKKEGKKDLIMSFEQGGRVRDEKGKIVKRKERTDKGQKRGPAKKRDYDPKSLPSMSKFIKKRGKEIAAGEKKKEEKAKPKAAPLDRYRVRRQIAESAAAAGKERNLKKAAGDRYKKRREISAAAALEGAQRTAQRGADKSTALDALLSIAKTSTAGGRLGAARSLVNISAGKDPKAAAKPKRKKKGIKFVVK